MRPGLFRSPQNLSSLICGRDVFVITNTTIAPHYLDAAKQLFVGKACTHYLMPDGEEHKTLASVTMIVEALILQHHRRDMTIVGLGGGVVCDVAGFVASTFQRGVHLLQMPTSLLAQVDAAIGGKNGVNHVLAKNAIGTIYQPQHIVIDPEVLITLEDRHFYAALSEVVKYGLVYDAEFFDWLEKSWPLILAKDQATLQQMIQRCVNIKLAVVEQDEKDHGVRQILNFGHTLAHALEQVSGYQLLHGEAVAVGILWALSLSEEYCGLDATVSARVKKLLTLPVSIYDGPVQTLMDAMKRDKKHRDQFKLVLLETIGRAKVLSFDALPVIKHIPMPIPG